MIDHNFSSVATIFMLAFALFCFGAHGVDLTAAKQQLLLSYTSYCPSENIGNWTCFWCSNSLTPRVTVVDTVYYPASDQFAYVGYTSSQIVVAFRGTVVTSISDWINNLKFFQDPLSPSLPGVEVHRGFFKAWVALRNRVETAVASAIKRSGLKKISVTGHSLGAALSTLAAVDLQSLFKSNASISVWNFGSPRVGNDKFYSYYRSLGIPTVRMVNQKDIVPHVPPKLVLSYHHVANEIWYNPSGSYVTCDGSGEDPNCSDSLLVATSIPDHLSYMQVKLTDGIPHNCGGLTKKRDLEDVDEPL